MSVPDHRAIVEQVFAAGGHDLTTKAGAGRFVEAAAAALHAVNVNWGHLRKPAGRTHVVDAQGNRHAVDVVLYRLTGQIVDIIRDAGEPGAGLSWGVGDEGEYGEGDWYAPVAIGPPASTSPAEPVIPAPVPPLVCQAEPCRYVPPPAPDVTALHALLRSLNDKLDLILANQQRAYVGAVGLRLRLTPEEPKP